VEAEPEVTVVVAVGLVWALVLAAVELDCDAAVGPEAVDGPGAEEFVAQGELDLVLDQKLAKAAFEAAAGLAVAGRVVVECFAEVRAAGVAAAEGGLDVGGAEVVVELGFG
jgi:hypothetical protein